MCQGDASVDLQDEALEQKLTADTVEEETGTVRDEDLAGDIPWTMVCCQMERNGEQEE